MDTFNGGNHTDQAKLDQLKQGEYKVDAFGFLNQAWELFWKEPGNYIGYSAVLFVFFIIKQTFLMFIILLSGKTTSHYDSPDINLMQGQGFLLFFVVTSLVMIPLYSGINIMAFRQMSAQKPEFSDFFHGYRYMASLIAASFVQGLIMYFSIFFTAIASVILIFGMGLARHSAPSSDYTGIYLVFIMPLLFIALYIGVVYVFSHSLIIDRRLGFWQAMETSRKVVKKQWFSVFGVMLVAGLFNMLGAFAIGVGLLITVPVSYLTLAVAYKEIFGLQSSGW